MLRAKDLKLTFNPGTPIETRERCAGSTWKSPPASSSP